MSEGGGAVDPGGTAVGKAILKVAGVLTAIGLLLGAAQKVYEYRTFISDALPNWGGQKTDALGEWGNTLRGGK